MLTTVSNIMRGVTIEPIMLLYYTSLAITTLSGQNLVLQKACHPGEQVPLPTSVCVVEQDMQKHATNIETLKHLILFLIPVCFTLFAGPWSDRHICRKPLMYIPLCGQIFSDLLSLLNVFFWNWSPLVAALSQSIPTALSGWRSCFIIGALSYMADITSEQSRTMRLGINTAIYFLGTPIGAFLFGLIFHKIYFYGIFIMCVLLNTIALAYLYLFVPEIEKEAERSTQNTSEGFITVKHITDSLKTVLKKRDGYGRLIILLLVLVAPFTLAPLEGEFAVYYFFVRIKFGWNEINYGFYAGIKFIVIFFGTLITLGLFSRFLQIPDALIGMMSSVTLIVASLGFAFSSAVWQLLLFCFVDFMHGAELVVVFSIISKIVNRNELGKINSIIGVVNAIYPIINVPVYTQLYNHTLTQFPGAFFLLSCFYGVAALILFTAVYFIQKVRVNADQPKVHIVS